MWHVADVRLSYELLIAPQHATWRRPFGIQANRGAGRLGLKFKFVPC